MAVMLIAITGSIGSGKTYVAKIFEQSNIPVIYADNIAKDLIINDYNINYQVKNFFNIKKIDFKIIKQQIFKNKKKRLFLEKLVHYKVLKIIKSKISQLNSQCFVLELPMVGNLFNILKILSIDKLIFINCAKNIQISRVMHRDKLSKSEVMLIIKIQLYSNKILKIADYLLNGDDLQLLQMQAVELCSLLKNTSKNIEVYPNEQK
jgi:dephospho-CoA kinase